MLEKIKSFFKKENKVTDILKENEHIDTLKENKTINMAEKNKTVICVKCGKSVSSFATDENYNNWCLDCHNEKFK